MSSHLDVFLVNPGSRTSRFRHRHLEGRSSCLQSTCSSWFVAEHQASIERASSSRDSKCGLRTPRLVSRLSEKLCPAVARRQLCRGWRSRQARWLCTFFKLSECKSPLSPLSGACLSVIIGSGAAGQVACLGHPLALAVASAAPVRPRAWACARPRRASTLHSRERRSSAAQSASGSSCSAPAGGARHWSAGWPRGARRRWPMTGRAPLPLPLPPPPLPPPPPRER